MNAVNNDVESISTLKSFIDDLSVTVDFILIKKDDSNKNIYDIIAKGNEEDCWEYVDDKITSFIYTINQPMRGNQSPFTNVSIYDDNFLVLFLTIHRLIGDIISGNEMTFA